MPAKDPDAPHNEELQGPTQSRTSKGHTLESDPELILRLFDRYQTAKHWYQKARDTRAEGDARRDLERIGELYWQVSAGAKPGTIIGRRTIPADAKPPLVVQIDGKRYVVRQDVGLGREFARLLDVWTRYIVGQKVRRHDPDKVLHLGLLHEFGGLFDPPIDGSTKKLAQRFKIPAAKVQSAVRRWQRITSVRSIR